MMVLIRNSLNIRAGYDYNTKDINKTGLSYQAFVTMLKDEGNYDTEYLVTEKVLKSHIKTKLQYGIN